jgi:hypothetical protein
MGVVLEGMSLSDQEQGKAVSTSSGSMGQSKTQGKTKDKIKGEDKVGGGGLQELE